MSQAEATGKEALFVGSADGLRTRRPSCICVCGQWRDQGMENVANEGDGWG